jgi:hypothetical protein
LHDRSELAGGERLTIETANCYVDETYAASRQSRLDNLTGMTRDVMAKALSPSSPTNVSTRALIGLEPSVLFVKQ